MWHKSQMNPTFTSVLESCIRYDLLRELALAWHHAPDNKVFYIPYQFVALTWLWCHLLVDGIQKWPMFVLCKDLPYPTVLIVQILHFVLSRISKSIIWICQISWTMSRVLVLINNCARTTLACNNVSSGTFSGVVFILIYILYLKQLFLFFPKFPKYNSKF